MSKVFVSRAIPPGEWLTLEQISALIDHALPLPRLKKNLSSLKKSGTMIDNSQNGIKMFRKNPEIIKHNPGKSRDYLPGTKRCKNLPKIKCMGPGEKHMFSPSHKNNRICDACKDKSEFW
jgi:hypothetical protein